MFGWVAEIVGGVELAYVTVPRRARALERGKARRSAARSPNRAESQTTYRSNEGGNEKVISTNFSRRRRRSARL